MLKDPLAPDLFNSNDVIENEVSQVLLPTNPLACTNPVSVSQIQRTTAERDQTTDMGRSGELEMRLLFLQTKLSVSYNLCRSHLALLG